MEEIENCILCYTNCVDWILLNSEKAIDLNIKDILLKHFWLQLQDIDLSKVICAICWQSINNFHEFYVHIESIHKTHNKCITSINASESDNKKTTDIITLSANLAGISIIGEEISMAIIEEGYVTESKDINKEQSDSVYEDFNDDTIDEEDCNENDDNMENVPASLQTKKRNISPVPKQFKQSKTPKKRVRKRKPSNKTDYTAYDLKFNRYCHMQCDLCDEPFNGYAECKQHYREIHNKKGYIKCCNIKYWILSRAIQHCEWHENSEAFKCQSCEKCFADKYKLRIHTERRHTPANELKFNCDLCEKSFGRNYFLTQHKKASHLREEDKIYSCDACGLKFAVKAFLRAHVRRVHEYGDSRVCDVCAQYFKCSKSYDHHYLVEHTNESHKVQCDLCGLWVKHALSLKRHMLRKHRTLKEHACQTCGKMCASKRAVDSHIRTVHDFYEYPCTVCEKLFKKKQTLKEHMAQHTGAKDLYKCSYCSRTFRSSANMYAHRKRAHPKEYEENRLLGKKYPD